MYYFSLVQTVNISGSLKKRAAPLPPVTNIYGTLGNSHSRTPSDPIQNPQGNIPTGYHSANAHKRSPSTDSTKQLVGAKLVLPPNEVPPVLKPVDRSGNCTPNLSGLYSLLFSFQLSVFASIKYNLLFLRN